MYIVMVPKFHFSAQINLKLLEFVSIFFILLNLFLVFRIIFSPLPYLGIVAYHYLWRITMVSFMTMLTFKIVVKTLFILDFERMAMVSEQRMMMSMGAITTIIIVIHLAAEALLRNHRNLDHYARWCINVYLGKVLIALI